VFSARSRALDGVSWVQGGLVEGAVGRWLTACNAIGAVVCSLPGRRSFRELDAVSCLRDRKAYAGANSVSSRSMACMMMARRRARATRAFRIVDRLAIAKAQSFSFSWPL
jgi:hypothetical protein